MTNMMNIEMMLKYSRVQSVARKVLNEIAFCINENSTEASISSDCVKLLRKYGITETWYYNVPALVLLGLRSCFSISGKDYTPDNNEIVGTENLITVDLSPLDGSIWGDCARSFVFQKGKIADENNYGEFSEGMNFQKKLHNEMKSFVSTETTFEELFCFANDLIKSNGFENLDFIGNLGHSIEKEKIERIYIEKNNHNKLSSVNFFTFEPHIKIIGGKWGFKHENIYYFDSTGRIKEL
jgi:hypothetical protein